MGRTFNKKCQELNLGKNLPPSYHKLPGMEYDPEKSEVIKWLIQEPFILNFIWDQFKQSGNIEYNPDTGKWQGVDYDY